MKKLQLATLIASVISSNCLALGDHEFDWSSRLRYANVYAENSGQAASLLLRGTITSEWNEVFGSTLEVDTVGSVFEEDHSDGVRFNGQPLIPDPPGSEINQAFVGVDLKSVHVDLGRQRINFDNQRFVGGNGFWQNEQTFDALLAKSNILSNSTLVYGYIENVNRIYGEEADKNNPGNSNNISRAAAFLGDHRHNSHLARLEWNEWDYTRVVTYAYHIDNRDLPAASNDTFGASYNLNYKVNNIKYRLQIEAARQDRYEISENNLHYYLVDLGLGINTYEISTRYEILGSNQQVAFITPLGSNHDFEGWSDEIGNTPNTGVRNFSVGLLWRSSPFRVETFYHFFEDDQQGESIGRELDFDFIYKPAKKHSIFLRFANFEPASSAGSVRKVFLGYSYNL